MNLGLKSLLTVALDLFLVGKDVVRKADIPTMIVPKLIKLTVDLPCAVVNLRFVMSDIEALPGYAQELDLAIFIQNQFTFVTTDGKAHAILKTSLKLVTDVIQDGLALKAAIKS